MNSIQCVQDIFSAAVATVAPGRLVREAIAQFPPEWRSDIAKAPRILVVGAGKASAAMAVALEACYPDRLTGIVNVPEGFTEQTKSIRLYPARSVGSNHPTQAGVDGAKEMLRLLASAGPDDVAIGLISGGGSALLPCPAEGISLADKQFITKQLHASGAAIGEMNCVRKHLSAIKGGQLASAFRGRHLISLIVSDVVGDPLDVIASGPTVPDPTTFADARAVLDRYRISMPESVKSYLDRATRETPKSLPDHIHNVVIGSNATAIDVAKIEAQKMGYKVLDLGPFVEGETAIMASVVADIVRNIRERGEPIKPPACVILGGETTVTLGTNPGKGGRNQEFVLAMMHRLGQAGFQGVTVLSAGTDGEDGPTDAAGAIATSETFERARRLDLSIADHLARHDAYPFFDRVQGLLRTGLTGTNVMDLRIVLIDERTTP